MNGLFDCRKLHQYLLREIQQTCVMLGLLMRYEAIWREYSDDCNLVASLEFRASQAVLPCLERQLAALDYLKAYFLEESLHIGEGEYSVELERLASEMSASQAFGRRPEFGVPATASERISATVGGRSAARRSPKAMDTWNSHGEIADGFGHFEFGARQHDALDGVAVDELENWRDIAHAGFANVEPDCGSRGLRRMRRPLLH